MKGKYRIAGAACVIAALAGPALGTVTVFLNPVSEVVTVGDVFSLEIKALIPDQEAVLAWGLDLDYEVPGVLARTSTPPVMGAMWRATHSPDGDGLTAAAQQPGTGVSGTVVLATIEFQAVANGETGLLLGDDYPADLLEGFALMPPPVGGFAQVAYVPGRVYVVPEPGMFLLAVLAGGHALIRRRPSARSIRSSVAYAAGED